MIYLVSVGKEIPFAKKSKCIKLKADNSQITIGRIQNATVILQSVCSSRNQCTLKQDDGKWQILDEGSRNGTYINGKRLTEKEWTSIAHKDVIGIGPEDTCKFRFLTEIPVACTAPTPEAKKARMSIADTSKATQQLQMSQLQAQLSVLQERLDEATREKQRLEESRDEEVNRHCQQRAELEGQVVDLASELQGERQRYELMNQEWAAQLKDQEEGLMTRLCVQQVELEEKLEVIKCDLAKENGKKLEEQRSEVQQELEVERQRLERAMESKEAEMQSLSAQLANSELKCREELLGEMAEVLESQLNCQVCTETLVSAVTTNCGHSFCGVCLRQWLSVKGECPICRQAVTSFPRNHAVDNYIEKMVDFLPPDVQEERKKLVIERETKLKELERQFPVNRLTGAVPNPAGVSTRSGAGAHTPPLVVRGGRQPRGNSRPDHRRNRPNRQQWNNTNTAANRNGGHSYQRQNQYYNTNWNQDNQRRRNEAPGNSRNPVHVHASQQGHNAGYNNRIRET